MSSKKKDIDRDLDRGLERNLTRRRFLQTTAAGATAAAGLGSSRFSPVGTTNAIAPVVAGAALGAGAVAVGYAGYKVREWQETSGNASSSDATFQMRENIHQHALDISNQMSMESSEFSRYEAASTNGTPQNTPYGNAAWQKIRAIASDTFVNGGTKSSAKTKCQTALEEQTAVSAVNIIEVHNSVIKSLYPELQLQDNNISQASDKVIQNSWDTFTNSIQGGWVNPDGTSNNTGMQKLDHNYLDDLPGDKSEWDRVKTDTVHIYAFVGYDSGGGNTFCIAPTVFNSSSGNAGSITSRSPNTGNTVTVIDVGQIQNALSVIQTAYNQISGNIGNYVDELWTAFDSGTVEPKQVVDPETLLGEYSQASQQDRMTAELMSVGIPVPEDMDFSVQFSHPDISASPVWGKVFPSLNNGPVNISAATTLTPSDYDTAYVGWWDTNDEWQSEILSGNKDLTIKAVSGLESGKSLDGVSTEAAANGKIVLGTGNSAPEPIRFPNSHTDWKVTVTGDVNTSSHSVTDITQDGDDYVLSSTSLEQGETVKSATVSPPAQFVKPHEPAADPSNLDAAQLQKDIQRLQDLQKELEKQSSGGGIAIPGLGTLSMPAVLAGGGVIAYFLFGDN